MSNDERIPYSKMLDHIDAIATSISDQLAQTLDQNTTEDRFLLPTMRLLAGSMVLANTLQAVSLVDDGLDDPEMCCQTINQFWALLELPFSLTTTSARDREPDAPQFPPRRTELG